MQDALRLNGTKGQHQHFAISGIIIIILYYYNKVSDLHKLE